VLPVRTPNPYCSPGVELRGHRQVGVLLGEVEQRAVVVDRGGDVAGLHGGEEQPEVLEHHELGALDVLLRVRLPGRAVLHAQPLAGERARVGDPRVGRDEQRLGRLEIGVGEVEVLLARLRDRHGRGGDVALARVEVGTRLDRVERGVDDRLLHPEALCDEVDHVHVESDDLVALLELERLVRQVRAGRELPAVDEVDATAGLRVAPVTSAAAPREGEGQCGCAERGRKRTADGEHGNLLVGGEYAGMLPSVRPEDTSAPGHCCVTSP
jgi:hypothetical protein